jgi:hypothetical protein
MGLRASKTFNQPRLYQQPHRLRSVAPESGGGPAFTWEPNNKSGLQLWLKSNTLSLNNGDPVSTWSDSSGNGRNATNTGANRPTFSTSITLNGYSSVNFSVGSAQYLDFGTDDMSSKGTGLTIAFVAYTAFGSGTFRSLVSLNDTAAVGSNYIVFMSGTPPAANYFQTNFGFAANGGQTGWRQGGTSAFITSPKAGLVIYDGTNDNVATRHKAYMDNAEMTYNTPTGNFNSSTNNKNLIGHFPTLGAGLSWDGPAWEICVWNSAMTGGEQTSLDGYWFEKYAI